MFWAAAVLLCAVFLIILGRPLLKDAGASIEETQTAAALAGVLAQIEQDRAAGLIGEAEAEDAGVEAKRAALTAAPRAIENRSLKSLRFAAIVFLASTPLLAAAIYFNVGEPKALNPDYHTTSEHPADARPEPALTQAGAIAAMAPEDREQAIENMVAGLAARLQENPEDAQGWRMLARSYGALGQHQNSADAYRELLRRSAGAREDWRAWALTLIELHGEGGDAQGALIGVLETTLERFPGDALAIYQLGVAKRAAGDPQRAVALWLELLSALPPDAPIRGRLEQLIAETRREIEPAN